MNLRIHDILFSLYFFVNKCLLIEFENLKIIFSGINQTEQIKKRIISHGGWHCNHKISTLNFSIYNFPRVEKTSNYRKMCVKQTSFRMIKITLNDQEAQRACEQHKIILPNFQSSYPYDVSTFLQEWKTSCFPKWHCN